MEYLQYAGLFLCAFLIEVGWVLSVRAVSRNQPMQLALTGMSMQTISYGSTLILVHNHWTMVAGIVGAGLGAFIGLRIPATWYGKGDPTS